MKRELSIPSAVGFCKNCFRSRRHGSAYCGQCQDEPERMKVYQDVAHEFPLYKKVVDKFNLTKEELKNIIFTYGDTIYCDHDLPYGLIAHEITHVFQQLEMGTEIWWEKYLKGNKFRLGQELAAYQRQYRVIRENNAGKAEFDAHAMARDLSSHTYGNIIEEDKALELIKEEK